MNSFFGCSCKSHTMPNIVRSDHDQKNLRKSIYTICVQQDGGLVQKGMGCLIQVQPEKDNYYCLTLSSIMDELSCSLENPVTANRYQKLGLFTCLKNHHFIKVAQPARVECNISVSFHCALTRNQLGF